MNKPLFQIFALDRSGHRVSAIETESDRDRAHRIVNDRNTQIRNAHWIAVEIDRSTGRPQQPSGNRSAAAASRAP